ncbi:ATP-binding protein [Streptomyces sp. BE20]|uniref:ATP-binding protein n=1 Tax=unclassified Streptomyces TaxID=2593676 RepID=UPI002E77D4BE|nr:MULTISPECIES: ATP-binding protein [unclassified Streptomyces]MED7948843.1 ATP-binding protein [Streptomyces sp. BE303]MEE1821332.1 ATP-binding protein [Streptomyces sp. BE20]
MRIDLTIAAELQSVGVVRQATTDAVIELGAVLDDDQLGDAKLLASELVTNAVTHGSPAGGELWITWTADPGTLRVSVTDQSSTPPCLRTATDDDESGRGLALVRELADHFGWHSEPGGGKTVWFTLAVDQAAAGRPPTAGVEDLPTAVVTTAVPRAHGLTGRARPRPAIGDAIPARPRHTSPRRPAPAA